MSDFLSRLVAKAQPIDGTRTPAPRPDWRWMVAPLPGAPIEQLDGTETFESMGRARDQGSGSTLLHPTAIDPSVAAPGVRAVRDQPADSVDRAREGRRGHDGHAEDLVHGDSDPSPQFQSQRPRTLNARVAHADDVHAPAASHRDTPHVIEVASPYGHEAAALPSPLPRLSQADAAPPSANEPHLLRRRVTAGDSSDARDRAASASTPSPVIPRAAVDDLSPREAQPLPRRREGRADGQRELPGDDRPTVHVTIGRLEIRAPQPTAAAPAPRKSSVQPALDEYLRTRAARAGR